MTGTITDKPAHMRHMPGFLATVAPITIDHAEGSWVYDTDGGKWLDFVVGIAVVNTGHCHPKVVAAVQEQAAKVLARPDEHLPAPAHARPHRQARRDPA